MGSIEAGGPRATYPPTHVHRPRARPAPRPLAGPGRGRAAQRPRRVRPNRSPALALSGADCRRGRRIGAEDGPHGVGPRRRPGAHGPILGVAARQPGAISEPCPLGFRSRRRIAPTRRADHSRERRAAQAGTGRRRVETRRWHPGRRTDGARRGRCIRISDRPAPRVGGAHRIAARRGHDVRPPPHRGARAWCGTSAAPGNPRLRLIRPPRAQEIPISRHGHHTP